MAKKPSVSDITGRDKEGMTYAERRAYEKGKPKRVQSGVIDKATPKDVKPAQLKGATPKTTFNNSKPAPAKTPTAQEKKVSDWGKNRKGGSSA